MVQYEIDRLIGSRIRQRRIDRNFKLSELARSVGIDTATLQDYEDGQQRISAARLVRICEILDTPPVYMFLNSAVALEAFLAAEQQGRTP